MLSIRSSEDTTASLEYLLAHKAPSRLAAQDASLYDFTPDARKSAEEYLGWTRLATNPPVAAETITSFANEVIAEGLKTVVLIGQGGSTQASMTITKLNALKNGHIAFKTMDSISPVYVRKIFADIDPAHTLFIVSSKSGSTVEPTMLMLVAWRHMAQCLGPEETARHFVAITDPDSKLEQTARELGFRAVFPGSPDVGGRFSALSVFGLLPSALVGIDLDEFLKVSAEGERLCSLDSPQNPAAELAAFLYEGYRAGRDKFSLITSKSGRVFGLWVEQLIAESLGKYGMGILPNIETDIALLREPHADRSVIAYGIRCDEEFERDVKRIHPSTPVLDLTIKSVPQLGAHFIMWEYAVALCAFLMEVNPFDQPDVAAAKSATSVVLSGDCEDSRAVRLERGVYAEASDVLLECTEETTIDATLECLFASINPGDYFSFNAFLPFAGEERRVPLEAIRHSVAKHLGVVSCLEIGPRYLHSTGQFHKGGANNGVFLIVSADESDDIDIPSQPFTLGQLASAQARGDFMVLSHKNRRVLHLHLPNNDGETLTWLSERLCAALENTPALSTTV